MNENFIQSHVREAHAEMTELLDCLQAGEALDFQGFHVQMAHIFHHLNSAWNGRYISDSDWPEHADETAAMLEAFPSDLPLIGDDAFYDLPEYEAIFNDDEAAHLGGGSTMEP